MIKVILRFTVFAVIAATSSACRVPVGSGCGTLSCPQGMSCERGVCVVPQAQRSQQACLEDTECTGAQTCEIGRCEDAACVYEPAADGTTCDDSNACSSGGTCLAGACTGGVPTICDTPPEDECVLGDTKLRVYDITGSCGATGCTYISQDFDCADCTETCLGGTCAELDCDATSNSCQTARCEGSACVVTQMQFGTPCTMDGSDAPGVCNQGTCYACLNDSDCTTPPNNGDPGCYVGTCGNNNVCVYAPRPETTICEAGSCDDLVWTPIRTCGLDRTCAATTPTSCDDGDSGTSDSCSSASGCQNTSLACDPGQSGGTQCDDGNPCTADSCNAAGTCEHTETSGSCDDGNACTTNDRCEAGACIADALSCGDGNECTTDSCNPATGCEYVNNSNACDDGDACTTGDQCQSGTCGGTGTLSCDDGNECTTDACDPGTGCGYTNNANPCDDGDFCTVGDTCAAGACQPGGPQNCDDGIPCSVDTCTAGACVNNFNACECQDPSDCDDGNPCTIDDCSGFACSNTAVTNGTTCNDGLLCTENDQCTAGVCAGAPVDCNDSNACTSDSCDPSDGQCNNTPLVGTACNDGSNCTENDACTAGGACAGTAISCDDEDDCTIDSCNPSSGCVYDYTCEARSCEGLCGEIDKGGGCSCDVDCGARGDCCSDYAAICDG